MPIFKKKPLFKRVILKFSGEVLAGKSGFGIDPEVIKYIAKEIKMLMDFKVQVGIIIGGGNLFRGAELFAAGMDRVTGDHMGMVATMLNAIAMREIFECLGVSVKALSALSVDGILERYDRDNATKYLEGGFALILAGGTGNPLVTTDTALALRGIELKADLLLKATKVDGIYSSDPSKDAKAKLYKKISYQEALEKELGVMDLSSFCLCRDHNMRLHVFNMHKKGALLRIITNKNANEGTLVENK